MKYTLALIVLIILGGFVVYTTQFSTNEAPAQGMESTENPFGEGSEQVGTVETGSTSYTDADKDGIPTGAGDSVSTPTQPATSGSEGDAGTTPGVITRVELAKHNTQSDCWVGYKGTVYDITNWLPRHPGSAGAIAPFCGTAEEFAAAFNRQHGTKQDNRLMNKEGVKEGTLGN